MPVVLRGDNAYLNGGGRAAAHCRPNGPRPSRHRMARSRQDNLTQGSTAQVGKFWQEFGGRDVKSEREQTRTAIGFNGKFRLIDRTVNVDGYAQYSKLDGTTISYGVPNILRVQQATDAVDRQRPGRLP